MWTEWKGMAWWIGRQRLTLGPSTNPDSGLNAMDQIHFRGAYTGGWDFRVTVGSVLIDLKIGGVGLKLKASGQAWESWQVLITSWLPFGTKTRGRMKPRIPWKPLLTYNQLLTTPESEDQSLSLIPTGSLGGWGSAASTYHVRDFFFFLRWCLAMYSRVAMILLPQPPVIWDYSMYPHALLTDHISMRTNSTSVWYAVVQCGLPSLFTACASDGMSFD
jgi:hypothetical protein